MSKFSGKLKTAYKSILERIGDPLDDDVLYGPLHNQQAVDAYKAYISVLIIPMLYKKNHYFFYFIKSCFNQNLKKKEIKGFFLLI